MAKATNDYFGLPKILSAILAFFFGGILGIIVRFLEGKTIAGIVRLVIAITGVGAVILGIIDFVLILLNGKILRVFDK